MKWLTLGRCTLLLVNHLHAVNVLPVHKAHGVSEACSPEMTFNPTAVYPVWRWLHFMGCLLQRLLNLWGRCAWCQICLLIYCFCPKCYIGEEVKDRLIKIHEYTKELKCSKTVKENIPSYFKKLSFLSVLGMESSHPKIGCLL